ncbi:hypothetical protein HZH66_005021 [Vespula vulgaris]|uniref:Uncharacterized protein n=1 Tax=Vespula vulgaris TaxID=7454 RepID=A0A834NC69_VESVU|nr:hypothetical protein HZH66_005021 [Vespula vulgaris]
MEGIGDGYRKPSTVERRPLSSELPYRWTGSRGEARGEIIGFGCSRISETELNTKGCRPRYRGDNERTRETAIDQPA